MKVHPVQDWIDWAMAKAAGAPQPSMRSAALAALEEFCRDSLVVTEQFPGSIAATAANHTYDIPTLEGLQVAELVLAYFDGQQLFPRGKQELDERMPKWETLVSQKPSHYFQPSLGEVRIVPALDTGYSGSITGRCAWSPSRLSETVPVILWEQWRDGIADGILARVFGEAGNPWSNPQLSEFKQKKFQEAIGKAKKNALQGNVRKPQFAFILSPFR